MSEKVLIWISVKLGLLVVVVDQCFTRTD